MKMFYISTLTAFRKLYDQRFNNLVIYSVSKGIPYEQAKDIVQECFIKLWENRNSISNPTSYLFTAVRNSSINWLSASKNSPDKKLNLSTADSKPADETSFEEAIEYFQKVEATYKKIQELGSRYMDIFSMIYIDKMKIKDVANELGISENTVKTYLKRGKDTLRIIISTTIIILSIIQTLSSLVV